MVVYAAEEKSVSEGLAKSSTPWSVPASVEDNLDATEEDANQRTQECLEQEALAAKQAVSALDAAVAVATSFREPATEVAGEAHRALSRLEQACHSKVSPELIVIACEIKCQAKRGLTLVHVHGGYTLFGKLVTLVARTAITQKFDKISASLKSLIPPAVDINASTPSLTPNNTAYVGTELRQSTHEKVHALTYVPDHHAPGHVCIWWSAGRQLEFYTDASQSTTCFSSDKAALTVTSIAIDAYGQIWTGHLKGLVRVRKKQHWENVIEQRFFNHAIRCIAFDATGCAWMGDEAGYIKVVRCDEVHLEELDLVASVYTNAALDNINHLSTESGSLFAMMTRTFWPTTAPPEPEPCEGPVRCILIRDNRVWIGGGRCEPWIGLWDALSHVEQDICYDMKAYGVPHCMTQIPWGTGNEALEWSNNQSWWRLLTGHDMGQVLMWNPTGKLQPVLVIEVASGIRGLSYLASCHLVMTGHTNGQLALFSPPAADVAITGSPDGRVVPVVKPRKAILSAHRSSVNFTACQGHSAVSASANGTIRLWHLPRLLTEVERQGLVVQLHPAGSMEAGCTALSEGGLPRIGVELSLGDGVLSQLDKTTLSVDNFPVIEPSELALQKVIGNGAYGRVWLAEWGGTRVAVKEIGAPNGSQSGSLALGSGAPGSDVGGQKQDRDLEVLKNEVHMLGSLSHPNIVRFCAVSVDPPMIVMQHYAHGSLYDLLKKARRGQKAASELTWLKRLEMLRDVAAGMKFLHKRGVVHGDLRSPNLLLDYMVERGQPRFHIRIADFGLARVLGPRVSNVAVSKHTNPRWAAPEVITQSQLSRPADVYSFGVLMWELLTWRQPFEDMKSVQVIYSATQLNKRPEVPADADLPGAPGTTLPEYKELMTICWADVAEHRPSFSQVLEAMDHMREQESKPPSQRVFSRNQSMERVRELTTASPTPGTPTQEFSAVRPVNSFDMFVPVPSPAQPSTSILPGMPILDSAFPGGSTQGVPVPGPSNSRTAWGYPTNPTTASSLPAAFATPGVGPGVGPGLGPGSSLPGSLPAGIGPNFGPPQPTIPVPNSHPSSAVSSFAGGRSGPGTLAAAPFATGGPALPPKKAAAPRPDASPFLQQSTTGLAPATPTQGSSHPIVWRAPAGGSSGSSRAHLTGGSESSTGSKSGVSTYNAGQGKQPSTPPAITPAGSAKSSSSIEGWGNPPTSAPSPAPSSNSDPSSLPDPSIFRPLHSHRPLSPQAPANPSVMNPFHPSPLPPAPADPSPNPFLPAPHATSEPHPFNPFLPAPHPSLSLPSSTSSNIDISTRTSLTHWPTSPTNPFANTRPLGFHSSNDSAQDIPHTSSLPNLSGNGQLSGGDSDPPLIRLDSDPLTPRGAAKILEAARQHQSPPQQAQNPHQQAQNPFQQAQNSFQQAQGPHQRYQSPFQQQQRGSVVSPGKVDRPDNVASQPRSDHPRKSRPVAAKPKQQLISPFAMPTQQDPTL